MGIFLRCKNIYTSYIKNRISNKLIAVSLVIFLSFAFILTFSYYYSSVESLEKSFIDYNERILNIVSNNFEMYIQQISQLSLMIRNNEELIEKMEQSDYSFEVKEQLGLLDYSKIKQLGINKIEFYVPDSNRLFLLDKKNLIFEECNYNTVFWYRELMERDNFAFIEPLFYFDDPSDFEKKSFMAFRRRIINIPKKATRLIVNIFIEKNIIEDFLSFAHVYTNEELYLFDGDGNLFFSSESDVPKLNNISNSARLRNEFIDVDSQFITLNGESYLKVLGSSSAGDWIIVKLVKLHYFASTVKRIFSFGLVVTLLFTLIIVFLLIIILKRITHGILQLSKHAEVVGEGNLSVVIDYNSDDEIGKLTKKFNEMTEKIRELINEKYRLQLNEKSAVLKSLEDQIDPHFLYNTLQAISGIAIANRQEKIRKMLDALTSTFRYKVGKNPMVTVFEELEYISTYNRLLQLRFSEKLRIEYQVDNEIIDFPVPRMLFQTLVENSVKHALETTTKVITIVLIAQDGENGVHFVVRDDGIGVTQPKLSAIKEAVFEESFLHDNHQGTGLSNLYQRMQYYYNGRLQFKIESTYHKGFCVDITIKKEVQ